jgi:NACalpha-BTF3-like transcription factor
MKPVQLLELITLAYCEGPSVDNSAAQVAEIEKKMCSVRLRALNMLRKWNRLQPYHFREDAHLSKMLTDFLSCVKVTGNEKLGNLIESERQEKSHDVAFAKLFPGSLLRVAQQSQIKKLNDLYPEEMARQLCLLDQKLYLKLEVREFVKNNFMRKNSEELCPNIKKFAAQFNHIANTVFSSILRVETSVEDRARMLEFWIETVIHLRKLRNYQSLLAIIGGLTSSPINRLKKTWALVSSDNRQNFEECKQLMDKNFSLLRQELETAQRPVIPYIGAFQRDLVYLEESPTFKDDALNLHKLKSISNVIGNILQYQNSYYNWFEPLASVEKMVLGYPVFDETESHQISLRLEPREVKKSEAELAAEKAALEVEREEAAKKLIESKEKHLKAVFDLTASTGNEEKVDKTAQEVARAQSVYQLKLSAAPAETKPVVPVPKIEVSMSDLTQAKDSLQPRPQSQHSRSKSMESEPPHRPLPKPPQTSTPGGSIGRKSSNPRRRVSQEMFSDDDRSPSPSPGRRPRSGEGSPLPSPRSRSGSVGSAKFSPGMHKKNSPRSRPRSTESSPLPSPRSPGMHRKKRSEEEAVNMDDVELVMVQTNCTKQEAIDALKKTGDVVNAIMEMNE